MIEFSTLSRDERALYNPAFTGLTVARCVQGHQAEVNRPCPVAVAILAAVMALQPTIRNVLPRSTASGLHRWVQEHSAVRSSMALNATAIAGVVRPGLLMALQTRTLVCDIDGNLHVPKRALKKAITGESDDVVAVQKAAFFLGRWLPSAGSISTVMTLLGVRP
ncbi:three component ABC system middle component [Streptomyces sp. DT190]|uniref:three component ABC system middle component n=1 Tax=unclassified Streptomyces TaxID=2593676 RepID=UPI003CF2843A